MRPFLTAIAREMANKRSKNRGIGDFLENRHFFKKLHVQFCIENAKHAKAKSWISATIVVTALLRDA